MRSPLHRRGALALAGLLVAAVAAAHQTAPVPATLALPGDGTFALTVVLDLDALALGVGHHVPPVEKAARLAAMTPAARAERRQALEDLLARRLRVRFDGEPADVAVSLPAAATGEPGSFGDTAVLSGAVPDAAVTVTVSASRAFPALDLTVRWADVAEAEERVPQATPSRPFPVTPPSLPVD